MPLTPEEGRRLHVLNLLERGQITTAQAAEALEITPRQIRRLRGTLRQAGPAGLAHKSRERPAHNRLAAPLRAQVVALARGRYVGLNDVHLTEKLTAIEGLSVSRATVRRILRAAGVGSPRRRRPPLHRSRRPRRAQAGLLCQLDGSPHAWFGPSQPSCSLLGAIDDATGTVLAGRFRVQEDAAGYLTLLRTLGQTVGLPAAVYTDQHGIFVRNDAHWTLAEELQGHQDPTQVGHALATLAIAHLVARSPQAKGRIERLWDTLQDRLVAELRLAEITTLAAGDVFLATIFLPAFNAQFAVPPALAASAYRPVPRGWDLSRICAFHYARAVAADNTVRVDEVRLQLLPGPGRRSYAKAAADVVQCLDGSWRVYIRDRLVAITPAPADPGQLRARKRQ
jgi:Helix-turn-helix domain